MRQVKPRPCYFTPKYKATVKRTFIYGVILFLNLPGSATTYQDFSSPPPSDVPSKIPDCEFPSVNNQFMIQYPILYSPPPDAGEEDLPIGIRSISENKDPTVLFLFFAGLYIVIRKLLEKSASMKKILSLLFLISLNINFNVNAQEVIARWDNYPSGVADTVFYATNGNDYNKRIATLSRDSIGQHFLVVYTDRIPASTNWDNSQLIEKYWIATFSTQGNENITFTSMQISSRVGPRDFKVQYKVKNGSWTDVNNAKVSVKSNESYATLKDIPLPEELYNQTKVSLRWIVTQNITTTGASTISQSSTSRINLTINGTPIQNQLITTWMPESNSTNWNDSRNWSHGVPGENTNVVIPSGCGTYPILAKESAAVCDSIFFMSDHWDETGEVARTCFLQYNAAIVNLLLSANQYHLIAPPLCDVYSGDFYPNISYNKGLNQGFLRQTPAVWMKLYQADNPEKPVSVLSQGWSGYFNTLDYSLDAGSGLCIWIDDSGLTEEHRTTENLTMSFPKDSLQYLYYNADGNISGTTKALDREANSRFIYEQLHSYDSNTGRFEVPVTSDVYKSDIFNTAIVGNPFMSHLDFSKFQAANSDKIEAVYRIWGGDSFDASVLYGDEMHPLADNDYNYIAPMQSFVVVKKSSYGTSLPLNSLVFTPDMSDIRPGVGLRSASYQEDTGSEIISEKQPVPLKIHTKGHDIHIYGASFNSVRQISCYDMQGCLINIKEQVNPDEHIVNVPPNYPIVIIRIRTDEGVTVKKVRLM